MNFLDDIISHFPNRRKDLELVVGDVPLKTHLTHICRHLVETELVTSETLIVSLLTGGFCITADVLRCLGECFGIFPKVQFIQVSSYETGEMSSSGKVQTYTAVDPADFSYKDILLIDDIYDSGLTLNAMRKTLKSADAKRVTTLVAVLKMKPPTYSDVELPDYSLCTLHSEDLVDSFYVGYGMDNLDGKDRGINGIYRLVDPITRKPLRPSSTPKKGVKDE